MLPAADDIMPSRLAGLIQRIGISIFVGPLLATRRFFPPVGGSAFHDRIRPDGLCKHDPIITEKIRVDRRLRN